MPPVDLGQRTVVITGSSTGIGAACVAELDRRGFRVFAGVRSEADGRRLQATASDRLTPLMLDVTDPEQIAAAVQSVTPAVQAAGLAGLVNNAGIVVCGPLEVMPLDYLRRQLEVNVLGQLAVTQAFLPLLRTAKGRIVNIGSVNGRLAPPYMGPYAASKFALEALTDAMRVELRHTGVGISIVQPANVVTPIWDKSIASADQLAESVSAGTAAETLGYYHDDLQALRQAARRLCEGGISVRKVVRAVVHALCARRPKMRYPVGLQAYGIFWAVRWVPDRIRDHFVKRGWACAGEAIPVARLGRVGLRRVGLRDEGYGCHDPGLRGEANRIFSISLMIWPSSVGWPETAVIASITFS